MSVNEINWEHEKERYKQELWGLVRALMTRAMRRHNRLWLAWGDMVDDACIFAWRTWQSLRRRGLEPQEVDVWAIANQCVQMVLAGRQFRPVGRGDRCWADSPYNPRNNCEAHDLAPWLVPPAYDEGPEMVDLRMDLETWMETLCPSERQVVTALMRGASDAEIAEQLGVRPITIEKWRLRLAESFKDMLDR